MTAPLLPPDTEVDALADLDFPEAGPNAIRPDYTGRGIVNVPWSALAALGIPPEGVPLSIDVLPPGLLDGVRSVLVIVIDGLGYLELRGAIAAGDVPTIAGLVEKTSLVPLTSTFPSTTVAALTALQTGAAPSRHGMVGFTCYLREYGMLSNLLRFGPAGLGASYVEAGVDPATFVPVPRIYDIASRAGVSVETVNFHAFETSPLTRIHAPEVPYYPYQTLSEFGVQIRRALVGSGRRFVFAYWPMVDLVGHRHGPQSAPMSAELRLLDAMLGRELVETPLPRDTLVMFTADHGHVRLDPEQETVLNHVPALLSTLRVPPGGERRVGYFHALPKAVDQVSRVLEELVGERGWVVSAEQLMRSGLYGPEPLNPEVPHRIGDVALIARGGGSFPFAPLGTAVGPMVGAHGALDAEEMLVPFLCWRPGA